MALAECNGVIVGHYATIPVVSTTASGLFVNTHLSMTTMIDRSFIKYNLFQQLAELVYSRLESQDIFVFMATLMLIPNLVLRKGSIGILELAIKSFDSVAQYIKTSMYTNYYTPSSCSLTIDLTQSNFVEWRFSKPGSTYSFVDGAYFKQYGSSLDLMYVQSPSDFEASSLSSPFNALCNPDEQLQSALTTRYFSGHRALGLDRTIQIFSQLSCSDVF